MIYFVFVELGDSIYEWKLSRVLIYGTELKMRVVFKSPNESKYPSLKGKWSDIKWLNDKPKQISMIVRYTKATDVIKKRVVLKNNEKKGVYEYTLGKFEAKCIKKLGNFGLDEPFTCKITEGEYENKFIAGDDDILKYLKYYDGEVEIVEQ